MKFPNLEPWDRVIIATKGLPFAGREQLSLRIANWAKCPILSLYGVLNGLSEGKGRTYLGKTRPSEAEAKSLEHQAFNILCKMAKTNTGFCAGSSLQCVVIDSPLSSTCQLDQLLEAVENSWRIRYKLIIIECRVKNIHKLHMRFDQYNNIPLVLFELSGICDERERERYWFLIPPLWFLPRCWEDAERAIQAYDARTWDDHFHSRCANSDNVKKIVLDPQLDLRYEELEREGRTSPFGETLSCIINDEGVPHTIELDQWAKQLMERKLLSPCKKSGTHLCEYGDCLFKYEDYLVNEATCMACDKKISQQAYVCRFCTLTLHKLCAEIRPNNPKKIYIDDVVVYERRPECDYRFEVIIDVVCGFPNMHVCDSCGSYSRDCASCILKTHLKCLLMPTIVKGDSCHDHLLSIRLAPNQYREHGRYYCKACGEEGNMCSYFCIICRFSYHVRCALSPRELEHQHGGYNHLMKLKSSRVEEEEEDYWCDVCCKDMDPECWYYSCQDCPYYSTHIHCAHVKPEHKIYLPSGFRAWPST